MNITKKNPADYTAKDLLILGETNFRNRHLRFGMLPTDRLRHLWLLGKTGSGKSTLIANLVAQDMRRGTGLALLDPHGDLVETVLPFIPPTRLKDTLLFDPADKEYPLSFNVFRQGKERFKDTALLASQLLSVFRKHWADSWGPRLEHVLRNAILAVASDERASLLFLYRFLTEEGLRDKVVEKLNDPVVKQFWMKEFPGYGKSLQAEAVAPVLNKLGAFVSQPLVRNIVGQVRSRVDLGKILSENHILLADLSVGKLGEDASHLLGGLLLTGLQLSAMERGAGSQFFIIYADEFQHFVTDAVATMLSEARKFGLGLVLAHQYLGQLTNATRDAILGNVGSMMVFRVGGADARILATEMYPVFNENDLQELARYHTAAKLLARGETLRPFSARTLSLPSIENSSMECRMKLQTQTRTGFCLPRSKVEQMIREELKQNSD
jgi:hypothetical protein